MKKILFLTSLSLLFIQCNKQNELPELAIDNDYKALNLRGRVCEINQKITILEESKFNIEDKNSIFYFSPSGYLIGDSIFNSQNVLVEVNTYEKQILPLTKKQFIQPDNFILSETSYDSLKNVIQFRKSTSKNITIEEQKNTTSDNYIVREDYFIAGKNGPQKVIEYYRDLDLIKAKVIYSNTRKILDSIVYDYAEGKVSKELHYNEKSELISSIKYLYNGTNVSEVVYLNDVDQKEAIEKFEYNSKNKLTYQYVYSIFDNNTSEVINTYNQEDQIIKTETKLNNKLTTLTNYTYNTQGDLDKLEIQNFVNKENFEKTFIYTYDSQGNWITKEVSFNKKPTFKIQRDIKYCK